jgi:hypothetical protein
MVSGATGIDATLLVVNGCEGVMPQTAEHVAIADLLGVRRGVVAINKSDLLDAAARAKVQQRVRAFLRGTHLEFAPVAFVSALTGEGVAELGDRLSGLLEDRGREPRDTAFRAGGMQPPDPPCAGSHEHALLELMIARGDILLLPGQPPSQRVALHSGAVAAAKATLVASYPPPGGFTVSQARALLGSTRKFTVPLLEHLHASGATHRRGDLHAFSVDHSSGGV